MRTAEQNRDRSKRYYWASQEARVHNAERSRAYRESVKSDPLAYAAKLEKDRLRKAKSRGVHE